MVHNSDSDTVSYITHMNSYIDFEHLSLNAIRHELDIGSDALAHFKKCIVLPCTDIWSNVVA